MEFVEVKGEGGVVAHRRADERPIAWAVVKEPFRFKSLSLQAGDQYPLYTDLALKTALANRNVMVIGQTLVEQWAADYGEGRR